MQEELLNLSIKRQNWLKSTQENNFNFDSLLAGLYSEPTHFIYELLQNAEDANATQISFLLENDKLVVSHNGRDFDFNDVDGITAVGKENKSADINKIGQFGVGFKSVFTITSTPQIHSGQYHFQINDFVLPSVLDDKLIDGTEFVFPFNHPSKDSNETYSQIRNKLEQVDIKAFLFLRNIKEIKWLTEESSGHLIKESNDHEKVANAKFVQLVSSVKEANRFEEYLVLSKPVEDHPSLKIEVAYRLGSDEEGRLKIIPELESKLFVYFPTEMQSGLNFLIQVPFRTTPSRENVPLSDPQNNKLLEATAKFIAETIKMIKEIGLLDVQFLEMLPLHQLAVFHKIARPTATAIKDLIRNNEPILPLSNGEFGNKNDVFFAGARDLIELLDSDDLQMLFGKKYWLSSEITIDRTRTLKEFLIKDLWIKEVSYKDFAEKLSKDFLLTKNDDWFIKFYSQLLSRRGLWESDYFSKGILRYKPIIKLSNDSVASPFDSDDRLRVFLPSSSSTRYSSVKKIFLENEESKQFLIQLGLEEPDLFSEIYEFILPKYLDKSKVTVDEYKKDLTTLLKSLNIGSDKKTKLFEDLRKASIILFKNKEGNYGRCKPNEAYFPIPELIEYFNGYEEARFIDSALFDQFPPEDITKFFENLNCNKFPRLLPCSSMLSEEEKHEMHRGEWTYDVEIKDYDLEGLDNFLRKTDLQNSLLLWKLLSGQLVSKSPQSKYLFKGSYRWFRRSDKGPKYFDAFFTKKLKRTTWLYDKKGIPKRPSELTIDELDDRYDTDKQAIEILSENLGFKLDEILHIETKTGGKFIPAEEVEEYERYKNEKRKKSVPDNQKGHNEWKPLISPENIIEKKIKTEMEPGKFQPIDFSGKNIPKNANQTSEPPGEPKQVPEKNPQSNISAIDRKNIGKWGEQFVYNNLLKKYQNSRISLIWLNEKGDGGRGCDFILKENEEEQVYIEVKTKTGSEKELISVNGAQWEFARTLYEKGEGDKYFIYIVSNAGTEAAEIQPIKNPFKLWKEGKLYAHPVHIKI